MTDPGSHHPPKEKETRIDLQQHEVAAEADNHMKTMHDLNDDLLRLCHSLLGIGHFRYFTACKIFLEANLSGASDMKITSMESVTSSVSRARQYFDDVGTGTDQLKLFWYGAARYGRVKLMEWALQQRYAHVWFEKEGYQRISIGAKICSKAAKYGQLGALKWLKRNGCEWDADTLSSAAAGGHFSCLRWAIENGCE